MSGYVFQHDTAGAHLGTLPHPDIAQDFGACTDQHAVAYFRVAIAFVLASAAQGDRLQNGDIVADHGGLTNDQPGGVVEHDALAHARRRVDIHPECGGHPILEEQCQRFPPLLPQPVRHALGLESVKTLEIKKRNVQFVACRVPIQYGLQVCPHRLAYGGVAVERIQYDVAQQQ